MTVRICKDCVAEGITTGRPAPDPGPRCATHWRRVTKERRHRDHVRRVGINFGLTEADYWGLYEFQGGVCYICQRSRGLSKRLAVDHDHSCAEGHPPDRGCPSCVRALLCGPCNQLIGRFRVPALNRAVEVLTDPPAQRFWSSE